MQVRYHSQPAYTMAVCVLAYGEEIRVESGAMAAMSDSVHVTADTGPGGLVKGLIRKQLGGETLFMGRYQATIEGAWVGVAPAKPGDILDIDVTPDRPGLVAESGSLLALSTTVDADVRWAGVKNIVLREGATMLHITGAGKVLLCTYGGFVRHHLNEGQALVVDTGHLVAYDDNAHVKVGPLGGVITAGFSGEGLVAKLTGGRGGSQVIVQTRAETALRSWILPEREQNRR